ncbi:acyl-CoA dehydrogenase family protein [Streptomyces sp. NPDC091217]|uniref:acyl-CoA dehydrogenase family protein n=1 Tax=Streptomyces sp. NPDC091217 TaxID=3365975 RepID=UPI00380022AF
MTTEDLASEISTLLIKYAPEVDKQARYPEESIAALKQSGMTVAAAPTDLGGLGYGVQDLVTTARALARGCGSTAMIWAMSQITLSCLLRHAGKSGAAEKLVEEAVSQRWLIASVVSEKNNGGNIRQSDAALTPDSTRSFVLEKQAASVSYGAEADALFVTARRSQAADPTDQVAVLVTKDQTELKVTGNWNTLGMRGTRTLPLDVRARFDQDHILADPFKDIAGRTLTPMSCVLQAAVWCGLAEEAVARAVGHTRRKLAKSPQSEVSPTLAEAHWRLSALSGHLRDAVELVSTSWNSSGTVSMKQLASLNALKLGVSELALDVCFQAMRCCGLAGYSEEGPASVARLLRDVLSAPLMISNSRIAAANSVLLTLGK